MPIQIACPCGKSLHVRDELSGACEAAAGCRHPIRAGVIGGVGVVITLAWMVLRIADPPIEITLKRRANDSYDEDDDDNRRMKDRGPRKRRREDDE